MKCAFSTGLVFFGLMLVASSVCAQQEEGARVKAETKKQAKAEPREKLLRDAEELIEKGKPADAYTLLESLKPERSGEVRFNYLLGIAAQDSGKPGKAALAFERVLAVDKNFPGARLNMALAYFKLGNLPRAKAEFQAVMEQNPSESAKVAIHGLLDAIKEREDAKRTRIAGDIEGAPGHDRKTGSEIGKINTEPVKKSVNQDDVYAKPEQGARQRAEGKLGEVEAHEKPLRDADELIKKGKPADAYALLKPLEFNRSGEARFDYLLGIAALDSGKPDKALLAFERVLAVDKDFTSARLDMARAYYQLGDLPRARIEFEEVIKQNPPEAARATIRKYLDKIVVQEQAKRPHIAGEIESTPGHDGKIGSAAEPVKKSRVVEKKPVKQDGAREKPLRDADELIKKGKPAEAYALLEPLEFDRHGDVRFDYLLGLAALDSGKPDKAIRAFERVLAVDRSFASARLDMARAYYQLDDLPHAKTEFEEVIKLNPPEAARITIQKYLDKIAVQEQAKRTRIAGNIEGAHEHDNKPASVAGEANTEPAIKSINQDDALAIQAQRETEARAKAEQEAHQRAEAEAKKQAEIKARAEAGQQVRQSAEGGKKAEITNSNIQAFTFPPDSPWAGLTPGIPATKPTPQSLELIEQKLQSTKAITDIEGLKLEIKDIRITGLTVISPDELMPAIKQFMGADKNFQDILDAAGAIRRELARRGYFLADAIIPQQKIENGMVEIFVIEGRLGKVKVEFDEDVKINHDLVTAYASKLEAGSVITTQTIERALFLISDLRGIYARSVFEPGEKIGTADLVIKISKAKLINANLDYDANGSLYTGTLRGGAGVDINNPSGRGDMLSARHSKSLDTGGNDNSRISYLIPLGRWGSKIGASYSELHYRLGTEVFDPLQGKGKATVSTVIGIHPIVRSRNANFMVMYQYDERTFHDVQEATSRVSDKATKVSSIALSGDLRDSLLGGGINVGNVAYTNGRLDIAPETIRSADLVSAGGHGTQGGYEKINFTYSRLQQLTKTTGLYFSYTGQRTGRNLDSSEKFSLGGSNAVRAYPQGEGAGDEGHMASLELRYGVPKMNKLPGSMGLALFYDYGWSLLNKKPSVTDSADNTISIAGYGVGLNWEIPNSWMMRTVAAWRESGFNKPQAEFIDRKPKVYFQLSKYY